MRGKKVALKQNFVKKHLSLLDIDVMYVIISTTPICGPFNNFLEKLMDSLHTDSTDIHQAIKEICFILNLYKKPPQRTSLIGGYLFTIVLLHCMIVTFSLLEPDLISSYKDEI